MLSGAGTELHVGMRRRVQQHGGESTGVAGYAAGDPCLWTCICSSLAYAALCLAALTHGALAFLALGALSGPRIAGVSARLAA